MPDKTGREIVKAIVEGSAVAPKFIEGVFERSADEEGFGSLFLGLGGGCFDVVGEPCLVGGWLAVEVGSEGKLRRWGTYQSFE